jgi:NAD(P)-dependent dehydrogenase (short-subunit alcohol dehydrogenase family)
MTWSLGLEDRGVVVTGAVGGIGTAIVRQFADAGAYVQAVDLDQGRLDELITSLPDPGRHLAVAADVTDLAGHDALFRRAVEGFGRLDVLAHAAAVLRRVAKVDDVTEADWDIQLDVNLKATFFLNRAAARVMREQGRGGRIVNFSSQGWWTGGFGGSVVYSASKGGIVSMTRGLARSWASDGIAVNCVSPGAVKTPMFQDGMTDEATAEFVKMIPMGRIAEPDELAAAVLFLASERASYLTGATINVSGGQLMY